MTSFRRVAFSLGFVAICGGALLFSLSTANGQPSPSSMPSSGSPGSPGSGSPPMPGMPGGAGVPGAGTAIGATGAITTGAPPLKQTIGVSPVQIGKKQILVLGGTGNETYDLQNENVYSLLRESGTPIPNVLHPLSTAKPSFILERLIVFSLTGGNNSANANASGSSGSTPSESSRSGSATEGSGATTQAPQGPSDAEKTVTAVRQVVDAEISRGTGRLGGAHRRKLQLLSNAIRSLEAANRLGSIVTQAIGGAQETSRSSGSGSTDTGDKSKLDPREILYGRARLTARAADRYTPNIP
ncbi:hypothetical protein IAD21_05477 [Abditibacteriota bacterium]|nr:hypothetical protein IAD21_05477 [Abditibacteriota bacterium]